jgi:hypothetical protein
MGKALIPAFIQAADRPDADFIYPFQRRFIQLIKADRPLFSFNPEIVVVEDYATLFL